MSGPGRASRGRLVRLLVACLAIAALGGAGAASAQAPKAPKPSKPVMATVNDFYFSPEMVTIKAGGSIKWVWAETNSYPHDVHLKSGPKGLKEKAAYSTKTTAVTDAHFQKTFPTPGTYHFICTIHPTMMHMTVIVKK